MFSLAIAYLRDRPLTTALNVLLLAIAVAMLVLILQFGTQARERLDKDVGGADLVVGAKGSPLQLILSSLFHIDEPTGNIPVARLEMLREDPAVARAVPLALGDNFRGFRIVGTDETFAELYELNLAQGTGFDAPMQAVLGADVARATGARLGQKFVGSHGLQTAPENALDDNLGHDHAPFETAGILAPSGTVADRLILTSVESVWKVHGIDHEYEANDHDHEEDGHGDQPHALQSASSQPQPELTAVLVTYANASGAVRLPAMIDRQTQMQAAVPATETARLLQLLGASLDGIRLFAWALAFTGGLAIFVALLNMARTREGDLALLRVMGASKRQVFITVILEGVITAALGAAAGWGLAHSLLFAAQSQSATLGELGLTAFSPLPGEALLFLTVLAIGAIAALIPALRVFALDPAKVLARG